MICATSEDSDQPAISRSLIRVFADRICHLQPPGYPKRDGREPLTYWVDVQAELTLWWSHRSNCMFCRALSEMSLMCTIKEPQKLSEKHEIGRVMGERALTAYVNSKVSFDPVHLHTSRGHIRAVSSESMLFALVNGRPRWNLAKEPDMWAGRYWVGHAHLKTDSTESPKRHFSWRGSNVSQTLCK